MALFFFFNHKATSLQRPEGWLGGGGGGVGWGVGQRGINCMVAESNLLVVSMLQGI